MHVLSPLAATAVTALTAASLTGPAIAAPPVHQKFTNVVDETPYDCDGTPVFDSGTIDVVLTIHERGSSPFPYFGDHVNGTIVHTNLATGGTYTEVFSNNFADHEIVDNGDGTITDTIRATGVVRFYDQFGKFVLKDPGTIWFAVEYDDNGTPDDPDDDVELTDTFRVIKPSTGNSDFSDRNFCDDLRTYTTAP